MQRPLPPCLRQGRGSPAAVRHTPNLPSRPPGKSEIHTFALVTRSYESNGSTNSKPSISASNGDAGIAGRATAQLHINQKLLEDTQRHLLQLNAARLSLSEQLVTTNRRNLELQREVDGLRQQLAASEYDVDNLRQQRERELQGLKQQLAASALEIEKLKQQQVAAPAAPLPAPSPAPSQYNHHSAPPPFQSAGGAQTLPPGPGAALQHQPPPADAEAPSAELPPPPPPPPPAPPATIVITYFTGWHDAFIHFNADGKGWTQAPGWKLERTNNHSIRTITIQGSKLEFVVNDGHDDWDSPGRFAGKPQNYVISAPGSYRLRSGKLERQ